MRKEAGFEVLDRINVYYEGNDKIAEIFAKNGESIGKDVLAESVQAGKAGYSKEWNINGEKVTLSVDETKESALAKAKEALGDKLPANVVKEIYVPGKIINIVGK